eukprot:2961662-Pyramimonas_sp.AAC.1
MALLRDVQYTCALSKHTAFHSSKVVRNRTRACHRDQVTAARLNTITWHVRPVVQVFHQRRKFNNKSTTKAALSGGDIWKPQHVQNVSAKGLLKPSTKAPYWSSFVSTLKICFDMWNVEQATEVGDAMDNSTGTRLLFRSEWPSARIKYKIDENEKWAERDCTDVHSSGGVWKEVSIDTSGPIEFVMTDGNGKFDKSTDGGNYIIPGPGVYRLDSGSVLPPPEGPVFMVVSDLDGTMVGDDATTLRFKEYWQREAVLRGCRWKPQQLALGLLCQRSKSKPKLLNTSTDSHNTDPVNITYVFFVLSVRIWQWQRRVKRVRAQSALLNLLSDCFSICFLTASQSAF